MPKRILVLGCLALHLFAGCGGGSPPEAASPKTPPAADPAGNKDEDSAAFRALPGKEADNRLAMAAPPAPAGSVAPAAPPGPATQGAASEAAASRAQILVYTAQITM